MTFPCINEDQFEMVDGTHLQPLPWMQWRHVATAEQASQSLSLDPDAGSGQASDLFTLLVAYTNVDPISMNVYGLVTRGGSVLSCSARNILYLEQYYGAVVGVAPADPATSTLISRFGTGSDTGLTSSQPNLSVAETRAGERAALVGTTVVVAPGETYKVRVRLRMDGSIWETVSTHPSMTESEITVITGATRLDLFAFPVL